MYKVFSVDGEDEPESFEEGAEELFGVPFILRLLDKETVYFTEKLSEVEAICVLHIDVYGDFSKAVKLFDGAD